MVGAFLAAGTRLGAAFTFSAAVAFSTVDDASALGSAVALTAGFVDVLGVDFGALLVVLAVFAGNFGGVSGVFSDVVAAFALAADALLGLAFLAGAGAAVGAPVVEESTVSMTGLLLSVVVMVRRQ